MWLHGTLKKTSTPERKKMEKVGWVCAVNVTLITTVID